MASLTRRVLTLLQFTRFALVFTAISNGQASLLLEAAMTSRRYGTGNWWTQMTGPSMFWMGLCSVGLYAFGMSLNDIIDRRRDAQLAADRPIPSGRIGLAAAHVVCGLLLAISVLGGAMVAREADRPTFTLLLVAGVVVLILFYDLAGKYLVPLGLLSLGLIRFFHVAIASPSLAMPWHALWLLNHVTILSTIAYAWEQKRPILSRKHILLTSLGLLTLNAGVIAAVLSRRGTTWANWMDDLNLTPALAGPVLAALLFAWVAAILRSRSPDPRHAGKTVMLVGLLWLIVYDATFVEAYVHWLPAVLLLTLMPIAWLGVRLMRAAARVAELSERPAYIRAR
ncbi:MAG: UbiA family prenyltransferase [Tepidisphaeraceae bacterium]